MKGFLLGHCRHVVDEVQLVELFDPVHDHAGVGGDVVGGEGAAGVEDFVDVEQGEDLADQLHEEGEAEEGQDDVEGGG